MDFLLARFAWYRRWKGGTWVLQDGPLFKGWVQTEKP